MLFQNGRAAEELIAQVDLQTRPRKAGGWARPYLIAVNPELLFRIEDIFFAVLVHLIKSTGSDFQIEFHRLKQLRTRHRITFEAANGNWSTPWADNLYVTALNRSWLWYCGGAADHSLTMDLLREPDLFRPPYQKTVLLIGDENVRQVSHMHGGTILGFDKGRYDTVAEMARFQGIDPLHYRYVIVNCGYHGNRDGYTDWERRWDVMETYLRPLRDSPYSHLVVNSGIPLPQARIKGSVEGLTQVVRIRFREAFPDRQRFHFVDWTERWGEPFVKMGGRSVEHELIHGDGVRLTATGFKFFWAAWLEVLDRLIYISYAHDD